MRFASHICQTQKTEIINFSLVRYSVISALNKLPHIKDSKKTQTRSSVSQSVYQLTNDTCECIYAFQIIISVAKHSLTATYIRRAYAIYI